MGIGDHPRRPRGAVHGRGDPRTRTPPADPARRSRRVRPDDPAHGLRPAPRHPKRDAPPRRGHGSGRARRPSLEVGDLHGRLPASDRRSSRRELRVATSTDLEAVGTDLGDRLPAPRRRARCRVRRGRVREERERPPGGEADPPRRPGLEEAGPRPTGRASSGFWGTPTRPRRTIERAREVIRATGSLDYSEKRIVGAHPPSARVGLVVEPNDPGPGKPLHRGSGGSPRSTGARSGESPIRSGVSSPELRSGRAPGLAGLGSVPAAWSCTAP